MCTLGMTVAVSKSKTWSKRGPCRITGIKNTLVVWLTGVFDDQHDCQACVGSNVLLENPARMRVTLSAIAGKLFLFLFLS